MQYLKKLYQSPIYFYLLIGIFLIDFMGGIYLIKTRVWDKNQEIAYDIPVNEIEPIEVKNNIKVDLKGEVVNPGVYELKEGETLNDLIMEAGGLKNPVDDENISLSFLLEDEMLINISNEQEKTSSSNKSKTTVSSSSKKTTNETNEPSTPKDNSSNYTITSNKSNPNNQASGEEKEEKPKIININIASVDELITLNGIGSTKAQAIIAYREEFGPFKTIEDIKNVKGIGEAIYAKIKEFITI